MKKRIIISVTNDLTIDQRVSRASVTLTEEGYDVLVVGRKRKTSPPLKEQPYREHRLKLWVEKGALFYLVFNWRLFLYLVTRKADIYLANDMDTLLANYLAARLRGKTLLYDSHEYWTEIPELIVRPKVRKVWAFLEKWLFPKAKRTATVNESIAEIYGEKYQREVHVIRNLPVLKPIPEPRTGPGRILIYQGALNVGRGLEMMLAAMQHLNDYTLWIIGYGPLDDEVRILAKELKVEERVVFHGLIHFEELHPITQQAALGMSLEEDRGASYHFALPNKLFDYIQAGIPVMVSDLPEMKRVVEEYGVGVVLEMKDRNGEALARRIRGVVEGEQWEEYRQASLKVRDELCWENEKSKLLHFVKGDQ